MLAALRFRGYRRLWTGAFLSSVGTWTQDVGLSWLIHVRLGNPVYLGLRSFAAEAPLLAFMLVGGAVADRWNRRRILLASQILQASFAASLALLFFTDRLGIGAILALAFLTGLAQSQSAPTYQAVLTSLVPARHIPNAVALNSLQFNLSRAIGPVVAGLLLARAGTGACFVANALSFLAVIAALARIEIPGSGLGRRESLTATLVAGLRHVSANPLLTLLVVLGGVGSFLAFPLITFLPVLADRVLGAGATGYSFLLTAFGVGAIAGALSTARRGAMPRRGRLMLGALLAFGVATSAAVLVRRQDAAAALLLASGFFLVTGFSTLNSLVQENATEPFRGRVMSIFGLAFRGGGPLGSLLAGIAVSSWGPSVAIAAFAGGLALFAALLLARSERLKTL